MKRTMLALVAVTVLSGANCGNVDESCHPDNYSWINSCPEGTAPKTQITSSRGAGGGASLKDVALEGYYAKDDACEYACVPYGDGSSDDTADR
jgi:hypothetical protein